uniref:Methylosome subunit pICln n=2 Tax=Pan TaxID=9596 RepID=A0A2I3TVH8_PANTR
KAVVNGKGLSTGTLYIAESHLSWLDGSGLRFSLEYPTICLHALSRDRSDYLGEHLYVMVKAKFEEGSKESDLSHLTAEGQTCWRLEGTLSQSVSCQYHMVGVRTEDSIRDDETGMEVDTTPTVAGQFEDADVDH